MRQSFMLLGIAASVQVLPAAAHNLPVLQHSQVMPPTKAFNHHMLPAPQSSWQNAPPSFHALSSNPAFLGNQPVVTANQNAWSANHRVQVIFNPAILGASSSSAPARTLNLDLSSSKANLPAGLLLANGPINITVGGKNLTVSAKTMLTPAEYLAVMQVAVGSSQSLTLDARGIATGGSIVINQSLGQSVSSLVIPQGVTVIDMSRSGSINVAGNITDNGNFYVSSLNPAVSAVSLSAANIKLQSQGLISDILPAGGPSSLVLNGTDNDLTLNLNSTHNISNAGIISSGGSLNLGVGSGNVTNSGLVASVKGSITIDAKAPGTNVNITGTGGTFQALAGNINVRDTSYAGAGSINMMGGNYLSQTLNLNSGTGVVTGSVGEVTGILNTSAQIAHINANTPVLTLGNQQIKGDPTYANTGDIDIAGPIVISGAADLAIIAGGNILATNSTASITDNGGNVLLIAGAVVTNGGAGGTSITGTNPPGAASGSVTVTLAGGNGGNIDFAGITPGSLASIAATVIDTSNSSGTAGNVTLVALASGATGGSVYLNNATGFGAINTHGGSGGSSGSVAIYGGANSGTAIQTSNLSTGGSTTNGGGDILLSATQAKTNDGNSLTISSSGSVVSNNKIVGGDTLTNANISTGAIDTSESGTTGGTGGAVAISTAGSVLVAGTINTGGSSAGSGSGGNGGAVTVTAGQGISLTDIITTGGTSNGYMPLTNQGLNGGNGGAIVLSSSSGDISIGNFTTSAGGGSAVPSGYDGGNGGQAGLIAVSAPTGSVIASGAISSIGGSGGNAAGSWNGGNAGIGGAIVFTAGAAIDISTGGSINSSGGIGGSGGNFPSGYPNIPIGAGGFAGCISLTAGTSITTNTANSIIAEGGLPGKVSGVYGAGAEVLLTAGTGNILTGNIAADAGSSTANGNGGNVLITSIGGNVTVGNTAVPNSEAAINASGGVAGSVTVSAVGSINLVSVDASNNVINASSPTYGSSVLLASAASSGVGIYLDGGNIATSGSSRSGNAWVISLTGSSHGAYTVNGAANINDYFVPATQAITTGTGTYAITFTSGSAPTNFSPGGYSTIDTTSQQIVVDTGTDSTLIVPVVSTTALGAGAFNIGGSASLSNTNDNYLALYGNNGIGANLVSGFDGIYLAAIVDTSNKGISITSNAPALAVWAAATNGPLSLSETPTGYIYVNYAITAANISFSTPKLGLNYTGQAAFIAQNGNINIQSPGSLYINGLATFTTGSSGSVSLLANGAGNTLTVATDSILTAATPNFVLQSPNIILGDSTYYVFTSSPIYPATLSNTAASGNLVIENPSGDLLLSAFVNLSTASSGTTSLLALSAPTSTLAVTDNSRIAVIGGGEVDIRTPNLVLQATNRGPSIVASGTSLISIDGGDSGAVVPVNITAPQGLSSTIATNGGAIIIHATGDLDFKNSGTTATTINLNASGTLGAGLVDIQGLGNVTIDDKVSLITNSPIQVNLNTNQTLTLQGSSILETTFAGNSNFPDPLGGFFQYSILVQNLITNFNLAGTGTILQGGSTPGNTVFNDFIDVGFAAGSNLSIQSTNPGSYVNFFTRQIQVNGTALDSTPTASLTADSNVTAINFNTNLPSPGPGNIAFQPGTLATSATLNFSGAPINVGFAGPTPPTSIPAVQQPVGNINIGNSGDFNLTNNQAISMYGTGTIILFSGSSVNSTISNVTLATTNGGNGTVILGGSITAGATALVETDGYGAIVNAGGSIVAPTVSFISDTGNIGAAGVNNGISTTATTLTASTGGSGNIFINQTGAVSVGASQSGSCGIFSLTASGDITTSTIGGQNISLVATGAGSNITVGSASTISASALLTLTCGAVGTVSLQSGAVAEGASVTITSSKVVNDGTIQSGAAAANATSVTNGSGALTISGSGSWLDPAALNLSAAGNLNAGTLFSGSQAVLTHSLTITASGGVLTLSTDALSVTQDVLGQGGSISLTATSLVLGSPAQPLTLNADASGSGNGGSISVTLTGTAPVTIGAGAGNLTISADGGPAAGNGGTATIKVGGNLVVNPNQLNVAPISGNGGGGNIILQSNSKTAFSIGAARAINGTQGVLSVAGVGGPDGTLSVTNLGAGGVTLLQNLTAASQVTLASGTVSPISGNNGPIIISANLGGVNTTSITLSAGGSGKITSATKSAISSANIVATSGSGAITLPDLVALQPIVLNATTGNKAVVTVTSSGANSVTLSNCAAGSIVAKSVSAIDTSGLVSAGTITLQTTAKTGGFIAIGGTTNSTGTITLTTAGQIMVNPVGSLDGTKSVTLMDTGASNTSTIAIDGAINTGITGTVVIKASASTAPNAIDISGADLSAGKSVTITATKSSATVDTIGQIQAPGTITLTALTNIENDGAVNAVTSVTEKTTATSGASEIKVAGSIQASGPSGKVTLTNAGNVGATSGIIATAAIDATKNIILGASKGDISVASLTAGTTVKATVFDQFTEANGSNITGTRGVTISTSSSTGANHGSVTLDSIETGNPNISGTAGGAINVTAAGGTLTVDSLAVINANSDKTTKAPITLENKLITGTITGLINIGSGAQITTAGILGGNVNIVMGAVPAAPKGDNLPVITGVNFNPSGTQSVIFVGATAINNGVNFANVGSNNVVNVSVLGHGVKVILNTGKLPGTAITINGGTASQATIITADPPVANTGGGLLIARPSVSAEVVPTTNGSSLVSGNALASINLVVNSNSILAGLSVPASNSILPLISTFSTNSTSGGSNIGSNGLIGSIETSFDKNNINASGASTRMLYGAATEYGASAAPYIVCPIGDSGDIDATILTGLELGASGCAFQSLPIEPLDGLEENATVLRTGNTLVLSNHSTTIKTAFCTINVAAKSMALIMTSPSGTSVYNLDDTCKESVAILIGKERVFLRPGTHAMVTSQLVESFEEANPAPALSHRNLSSRRLDGHLQLFTSEFSMINAISRVMPLRALIGSSQPQVKRAVNHMLKTSAIVSQISGTDQYQLYANPKLTETALLYKY